MFWRVEAHSAPDSAAGAERIRELGAEFARCFFIARLLAHEAARELMRERDAVDAHAS